MLEDSAGSGEEGTGRDDFGPPVSKDTMAALLKTAKRVDEREPTLCLSAAVIDTFRNDLLGGGTWGKKAKEAMSNKYYLSRKQYNLMEAPSLKGTRLYTAVRGMDFSGLGKTLLEIHQRARDLAKIGLREYEVILTIGGQMKEWSATAIQEGEGEDRRLLPEFALIEPKDITIDPVADSSKIQEIVDQIQKPGGVERIAANFVQFRRALRLQGEAYATMVDLYNDAKDAAVLGINLQDKMGKVHWDLLQHM